MLSATKEQEIGYIKELINRLLSEDIPEENIRQHVCCTTIEYIRSIIVGAQIAIVKQSTGLLAAATKSTHQDCKECFGTGRITHGLNLVEILREHPNKPMHFTPSEPKQAPADCRWICTVCSATFAIMQKSSDLRRHLRVVHGFPRDQVEWVFSTTNGEALYEHFGPYNDEQAKANDWEIRTKTKRTNSSKTCIKPTRFQSNNERKRKALPDDQVSNPPSAELQPGGKPTGAAVASIIPMHQNKRLQRAPPGPTTSMYGPTVVGSSSQLRQGPIERPVPAQAYYVDPGPEFEATMSVDSSLSPSMEMDLAQTIGGQLGFDAVEQQGWHVTNSYPRFMENYAPDQLNAQLAAATAMVTHVYSAFGSADRGQTITEQAARAPMPWRSNLEMQSTDIASLAPQRASSPYWSEFTSIEDLSPPEVQHTKHNNTPGSKHH